MSRQQVLQVGITVILVVWFLVGCGGSAPTAVSEAPVATSTPEQSTATLTPKLPTPTPEVPTATSTPVPPTSTPVPATNPPRPTSCEEVEGNCLEISFDGASCTFEGPTSLNTETVTVFFFNESESGAAVDLVRLLDDKTIQDLIDDIRERPTEYAPSWVSLWGMWSTVQPGEIRTKSGVLRPGIYGVVCGRVTPHHVYYGGELTVEE